MKISTKGRYALRLMVDLALNDTGEFVPLKVISARQNISDKYLEQIVTLLSRAGLVKAARGAQGGYRLAKAPAEVTVGDVLRLTEGSLAPVVCLEDDVNTCPRCEECLTLEVWEQLYAAITGVVDNITLKDIVERGAGKIGGDYCI